MHERGGPEEAGQAAPAGGGQRESAEGHRQEEEQRGQVEAGGLVRPAARPQAGEEEVRRSECDGDRRQGEPVEHEPAHDPFGGEADDRYADQDRAVGAAAVGLEA